MCLTFYMTNGPIKSIRLKLSADMKLATENARPSTEMIARNTPSYLTGSLRIMANSGVLTLLKSARSTGYKHFSMENIQREGLFDVACVNV